MKERIEALINEIYDVLETSYMSEESYDYLMNVKDKLERIIENEPFDYLAKLKDLEAY